MQIAGKKNALKGNAFEGFSGGRNYHLWSRLFGLTPAFYRKAIGTLALTQDQRAIDLGCGTGALCFTLAALSAAGAQITGLDISEDQLDFARAHAKDGPSMLHFRSESMDQLPFPDGSLDLVMTSMAMHEVPANIRRAAIRETARVLKTNGLFLLVDWCKPRLTPMGLLWYAMVRRFGKRHDNWRNTYRGLAQAHGMMPVEDAYITGFARRQLFRKVTA